MLENFFKFHPEEVKTSLFQLMFNLFSHLFIILPLFFPHFLVPGGNPPAQNFAKVCVMRLVESPWNAWGCSAAMIYVSLFMEI